MHKLGTDKIIEIKTLRKKGLSLSEIQIKTGLGYGTVFRYCKNVKVSKKLTKSLMERRGGSKERSDLLWCEAKEKSAEIIGKINTQSKLCMLATLYWGEGTKREFSIINGDPNLLRVFLVCLKSIGVQNKDLNFSLRMFNKLSKEKCIEYWSKSLGVEKEIIKIGEIVVGSKSNKLPFGMCRIRMIKGDKSFKLLISMIKYIESNI